MDFCILRVVISLLIASYASAKTKYTDMLAPPDMYGYSIFNGPDKWGNGFDSCGAGLHQSPINLINSACIKAEFSELYWKGHWDDRDEGFILENTWHSAEVQYNGNSPFIRGGPLSDDYILSQVHFHWGDNAGSEHSIDGQFYDMEAHLVHYKNEYGSVTNASEQFDGLAVIGLMFKATANNNSGFDEIISGLSKIHEGGTSTSLPDDAMNWILEHVDTEDYFSYQGSLTTPPCSEIVTWIVMTHVETIGSKQIEEFQKLKGKEGEISDNVRPIQQLNGRPVFYCSQASFISFNYSILFICLFNLICKNLFMY